MESFFGLAANKAAARLFRLQNNASWGPLGFSQHGQNEPKILPPKSNQNTNLGTLGKKKTLKFFGAGRRKNIDLWVSQVPDSGGGPDQGSI